MGQQQKGQPHTGAASLGLVLPATHPYTHPYSHPPTHPCTHPYTHAPVLPPSSHPSINHSPVHPFFWLPSYPFSHPPSPVGPHIPHCTAHPSGSLHPDMGRSLPGSPRVQTCTLPCACLPTVRSTVPRALARVIQGLVWGAKALLRACPLTCKEEQDV